MRNTASALYADDDDRPVPSGQSSRLARRLFEAYGDGDLDRALGAARKIKRESNQL
jgi:hypothetical protein